MKKIRGIRYAVVGAFLAACGASGAALAVDEVEPNFPITAAQALTIESDGSVAVNGALTSGDTDIYSFWAREGDVVTVDIDGGIKNAPQTGSIDTFLTVLLPGPTYTVSRWNDDSGQLDPGSISPWDSYISNLRIPADGVYYVAVTAAPNRVADGGVFVSGGGAAAGSYTLIVSGVSQLVQVPDPVPVPLPVSLPVSQSQAINIEIKPGHRSFVSSDPKARVRIPVALLSSSEFDALTVDVNSLTFGHTGDEQSLRKCHEHGIDVNRDGRPDLVCHFENQMAGFEPSDEEGILKGKTAAGTAFEGTGMLKVIPHKRRGKSADGTPFEGHGWHRGHRHEDSDDRHHRRHHRHR